MSLSLDDMGRAVWDAEWKALLGEGVRQPNFDSLSEVERRPTNLSALAAVERFAEEALPLICHRCTRGDALLTERCGNAYHIGYLHCPAHRVRQLLASLRAEAGQQKGSE